MGIEALHGKLDKLNCIVVGGQMDEVHKLPAFTESGIRKKAYRLVIGKMAPLSCHTALEIKRIRTAAQHLDIVVGLKKKHIRPSCRINDLLVVAPRVSDDYEGLSVNKDLIAATSCAVMTCIEHLNGKRPHLHYLSAVD